MKVSLVSCVVLYLCLPVLRPVVVQLSIFVVILRILAASYVSLVLYAMLYLCCCNNVHALQRVHVNHLREMMSSTTQTHRLNYP